MTTHDKERFVRQKSDEHIPDHTDKIFWSIHGLTKLRLEGLRKNSIENALKNAIIIEDYNMEGRPLPGCLVLGFADALPVHVVLALDITLDRIFVITVYKPLRERWKNDWKERRNIG
jgi:hypothetical protein